MDYGWTVDHIIKYVFLVKFLFIGKVLIMCKLLNYWWAFELVVNFWIKDDGGAGGVGHARFLIGLKKRNS